MNAHDEEHMKKLLQQALPPVKGDSEQRRDLWPDLLRRLDAEPAAPAFSGWAVFDGALLAGLVGLAAIFPAPIPVFLYYM